MSANEPAPREKRDSVRKALPPGRPFAFLVACLVALSGAACGQRGPLYLPAQEPPAATTPSDAAPDEEDDSDDETGRD